MNSKKKWIRESDEVFFCSNMLEFVDQDVVASLKEKARETPRRRARLCLHVDPDQALHQMLIVHPADAKKQIKSVEDAITSKIEVDTDALWNSVSDVMKKSPVMIEIDPDMCKLYLLALGETAAEYGVKSESEKKDF